MIVLKKKRILHELAISLFLMLEFDRDSTALSVINRIRQRAGAALEAAAPYTGVFGGKDADAFLKSKPLNFTITCGRDIVKGDVIRFIEDAINNKVNPPRYMGKRGIVAEVTYIYATPKQSILYMKVISSGGVWELKPDLHIRRYLHNMTRFEVKRVPWDDESWREQLKLRHQQHIKSAEDITEEALFTHHELLTQ